MGYWKDIIERLGGGKGRRLRAPKALFSASRSAIVGDPARDWECRCVRFWAMRRALSDSEISAVGAVPRRRS